MRVRRAGDGWRASLNGRGRRRRAALPRRGAGQRVDPTWRGAARPSSRRCRRARRSWRAREIDAGPTLREAAALRLAILRTADVALIADTRRRIDRQREVAYREAVGRALADARRLVAQRDRRVAAGVVPSRTVPAAACTSARDAAAKRRVRLTRRR